MAGMMEERFIAKRTKKLLYIGCVTLLSGVLAGVLHRLSLGDVLALVFVDVLFTVLFIFYLEGSRIHTGVQPDTAEDYQRICVYYTAAIVLTLLISFFPEYTAPVFVIAFLLAAGLNREQAFIIILFLNVQTALIGEISARASACCLMLMLLGVALTVMYEQDHLQRYAQATAFALCMAMPVLFYYLDNGIPPVQVFAFALLSAVSGVAGMQFLYEPLHYRQDHFGEISLSTIVDPNFHLVREMKKYSLNDYNHAMRVSRIAAHCAAKVKANAKLAAVSGFYYHLGKFGGEPFVESGVRIAQDNCFPSEVIIILSEFNGTKNPISTIESAIVHITDTLVSKFEVLDHTTLSSSWNRDMVIYQTLNEESSSGIYDSSGLTMNQFLKIREYLSKEEELL